MSSDKTNLQVPQDLISLQQPGEQPHQPSKVYIDSVKRINQNQNVGLLIYGTFPDACTHLKKVSHQINNGTLKLKLESWRNPEKMCAQVLTSFTYIYELGPSTLSSSSNVLINNTEYSY